MKPYLYICTHNHVETMYGSAARGRMCRRPIGPAYWSPALECDAPVRRLHPAEVAAHTLGGEGTVRYEDELYASVP